MKKILTIAAAAFFGLTVSAYTVQAILNWVINSEKAQVKFSLKAHGQDLLGSFTGAKGEISFDPAKPAEGSFKCWVDVSTIRTGVEARDGHLQAAGWFDAANAPAITFTSSKVEGTKEGFVATGTLVMKGVSKETTVPFTFTTEADGTSVFKGSFVAKRSDYGIGKAGGDIDDAVTINFEIPVVKG